MWQRDYLRYDDKNRMGDIVSKLKRHRMNESG